jgi:ABC-type transport system involved in multi-copper enzyme maturation permease subunit
LVNIHRLSILTQFELNRIFKTKNGLIALSAFCAVWFILLYYMISSATEIIFSDAFKIAASTLFGALGLSALLKWPVAEFAIYWLVAVYSFPLFTLFAASDQTCSDRARGTLRFITLRATRTEILLGRYLGQFIILIVLILLTLIACVALATLRDATLLFPSIKQAAILFIELSFIIMPFIALMSFLNSVVSSAKMSIVVSILFYTIGALLIGFIQFQFNSGIFLDYLFPGTQISRVVSLQELDFIHYLIPVVQSAVLLFAADKLLKRVSI